jgi:hypothetical protein
MRVGDKVRYKGGGSRSGHISFDKLGIKPISIFINHTAVESKSPYCRGVINTKYLKPIDWPDRLLLVVKGKVNTEET